MADAKLCPFCERKGDMTKRTFYEKGNWFAILAAPPNIRGHTILAVCGKVGACPQQLAMPFLSGLDEALADVAGILHKYYRPKHVVFSSLRVMDPHIHVHVFPVDAESEATWRKQKGVGYESGRFHEFLGDCESAANASHRFEREWKNWNKEQQRASHADLLTQDAAQLKALAV